MILLHEVAELRNSSVTKTFHIINIREFTHNLEWEHQIFLRIQSHSEFRYQFQQSKNLQIDMKRGIKPQNNLELTFLNNCWEFFINKTCLAIFQKWQINKHIKIKMIQANQGPIPNLPKSFESLKIKDRFLIYALQLEGRFGAVYKGYDHSADPKTPVQIKCVNKKQILRQFNIQKALTKLGIVKRQVEMMNKISHPKVLSCIKYFENEELFIIITNHCNEGSLAEIVERNGSLQFERSISILAEIADVLSTLHKASILHTCLTLRSIFAHNGQYYIGDFGVTNVILGTDFYVGEFYKYYVDISSLGIMLYQMLCPKGNLMEREAQAKQIPHNLQLVKFELKNGIQLPDEAKLFLKSSLKIQLTWQKLKDHPLFNIQRSASVTAVFIPKNIDLRHSIWMSEIEQERIDQIKIQHTNVERELPEPEELYFTKDHKVEMLETEYSDYQTDKYTKMRQLHLKQQICEYIYTSIIKEIQKFKPFNLERTNKIELMYMLSSRCFIQMTLSRVEIKGLLKIDPKDQKLLNFQQNNEKNYKKHLALFENYSSKLTKQQDKFKNIFMDFFRKIFFSQFMIEKNKLLNGQQTQADQQKKIKHIQWIQAQLNKCIKATDNKQIKHLYRKFATFEKVAKLELKDIDRKQFQQVVNQIIKNAPDQI